MSPQDRSLSGPGSKQLVVRVPAELHAAVVASAKANERTVAQEVRRVLRLALVPQ